MLLGAERGPCHLEKEETFVKMKYMKIGTRPDTFYTVEATRTVLSDVPTDLVIQINNTKYLLHKFPLIMKCGLLQRLCSDSSSSTTTTNSSSSSSSIVLPDFPGGEDAFELCAKFCYGISITLSARNFLPTFSAATFLLMTDSVSHPNLLPKLHTFFVSFILQNWKDSVVTLASSSHSSPPFSDPSIIRPLIDSIVSKILTPTSQVIWSFTYSRQLSHSSVPKDWWTEDIANLDLSHFQSIITAIRSSRILPPALIGEALHVYTVKNLPDPNETADLHPVKDRRALEAIAGMVPGETGAVSGGFLMRLLKIAILVGASAGVRAELVRRAGRQLDEVSVRDLVFYGGDDREGVVDFGAVEAVVESFFEGFKGRRAVEKEERERMMRAGRVFDDYLGLVAVDEELSVEKFIELAELVPEMAREEHDRLYRAIDTFLEKHTDLSKAERKQLCKLIDCRKLSPEARSQAVENDRLPLRTLVQLLFVEQERVTGGTSGGRGTPITRQSVEVLSARERRDQPRGSRQEEEEEVHRHHRHHQEHRHQRADEPAVGRRDDRARTSNNAVVRKKGEGSGAEPQAKGRDEATEVEKKKMAKRPG